MFLQVCSRLNGAHGRGTGSSDDAQFLPLHNALKTSAYGYENSDFLEYSYNGGYVQYHGRQWEWVHFNYGKLSPISQNLATSYQRPNDMLLGYHKRFPMRSLCSSATILAVW